MKKKLLAVAVVGALASPLAFAQNVTLYGGVDVGFQHADSGQDGSSNFVASGQWYTPRFGLKASEDLSGGLYALLQMEHGLKSDTGVADDPFWQRQVYAGLGNKAWGELTIGRQYAHMYNQGNQLLPTTLAGSITPSGLGGINTRQDNYIKFSSANFSGLDFGVGYSTGDEDAADEDSGKYWDAHVGYEMKPFSVDFAHSNRKGTAPASDVEVKRNQLVGKWDAGAFGVFAGYAKTKTDNAPAAAELDERRIWIQPVFRFGGNNEVYGLYAQAKNEVGAEPKTTWLGIAYRYLMSKRTYVYANWGRAKNDNGAVERPQSYNGPALNSAAATTVGEDTANALGVGLVLTF